MTKNLPPRPNLDHLRSQAKALLAALAKRNKDAAATFKKHLPSAMGLTIQQILDTPFRLADAQAAIARSTGFASWPQLGRHVDLLRAMEGTWGFENLVIEGNTIPKGAMENSRLHIDGDRFRTESPEAIYEGIFNIDVEASPQEIDIEFIEGPEAGNWNHGIFRLDGDRLEICLDLNGKPRPADFRSLPGSGHAFETLVRTSKARPQSVKGGIPTPKENPLATEECVGFDFTPSQTLTRLEGTWSAVEIVRDGQALPAMMLNTGQRWAQKNEIRISFGGQTMIHALIKIDEGKNPIPVDYYNTGGGAKGTIQLGIMKWIGEDACFCMGAPGQPRPTDFECAKESGRTLSRWKPKK